MSSTHMPDYSVKPKIVCCLLPVSNKRSLTPDYKKRKNCKILVISCRYTKIFLNKRHCSRFRNSIFGWFNAHHSS